MRILYIAAESANWVINLCNKFCELGHQVTCIVQDSDEYDKDNPIKTHNNLTRFDIPFNTFLNVERMYHIISKHLERGEFDIAFGSHIPIAVPLVGAAKQHCVPCGIMLLDIPIDLMKIQDWRRDNWKKLTPFIKGADLKIVNTHVAADELAVLTKTVLPEENNITYGINMPEIFNFTGVNKRGDYVISVCRLTPMKNCLLIAKALDKVKHLGLKYVAIGRNGGQLDEIAAYCKSHSIDFEHYNTVSEIRKFELIEESAMLIYPQDSEYIGGLSPFEAMYVGKPALVPNLKVMSDLYNDNANYFTNNDEDALGKLIEDIHNTPLESMEEELKTANEYCIENASFQQMAEKMISRMEQVAK